MPPTPSMRAASMMSSGIALIAAESIVMAKPAWIQIITTMRNRVFQGELSSHCWGVHPSQTMIWLSRPICVWLVAAAGSRRRTSR